MKEINSNILSDITVHMKYAKYVPELKRRETWKELVDRNMAMHIKKYPELEVDIRKAYSYVFTKTNTTIYEKFTICWKAN